ncbi:3-hydroxy-3-methylglutaryl coenzyme A reductase [Elysia marginata]|uniref:3-hydroxy-3-methylglutaryl coenzyme A reductase n=1 Tax=Elysia marginata TaxID=1093978 RepID=A0AAV4GQU8_9GAST|nr:3-hydroxy-3-methylglutaryl coenzyme A reductase [Elysia marginata]
MVTEESSVVASAAKTAKFWLSRGGFKATVFGTEKRGQVHLKFDGTTKEINDFFEKVKPQLIDTTKDITAKMKARGGGLLGVELVDKTTYLENYYQLDCRFETFDAMGANFINSCLEQLAKTIQILANGYRPFVDSKRCMDIVMSILSNYTPDCIVRVQVCCPISELKENEAMSSKQLAQRFFDAVQIANISKERAVTHNKGIMNGIDAVVIATANDSRAIEANAHAYACKYGSYKSLSDVSLENGTFRFWMEIPLALGTVGGVTKLHPLSKLSMELLGNPTAKTLMKIIASVGLAQNFAAVRSLITTGIQKGHMKMHLNNILCQLGATELEQKEIIDYFKSHTISFRAVETQLRLIREVRESD